MTIINYTTREEETAEERIIRLLKVDDFLKTLTVKLGITPHRIDEVFKCIPHGHANRLATHKLLESVNDLEIFYETMALESLRSILHFMIVKGHYPIGSNARGYFVVANEEDKQVCLAFLRTKGAHQYPAGNGKYGPTPRYIATVNMVPYDDLLKEQLKQQMDSLKQQRTNEDMPNNQDRQGEKFNAEKTKLHLLNFMDKATDEQKDELGINLGTPYIIDQLLNNYHAFYKTADALGGNVPDNFLDMTIREIIHQVTFGKQFTVKTKFTGMDNDAKQA